MALSIKDGTGNTASLKTTLDGANHRPHHIIDEISGSSIGSLTSSLLSISSSVDISNTKLTSLSSSLNSNLAIINTTITGSNTLLTNLSTSINTNLVNLSSSVNTNLVNLSSSVNTNLVNLSSSVKTSNDLLSSISSSVATSSKYASAISTTVTSSIFLSTNIFSFTSASALTVIATNLTNANLYLLLGSATPSATSYTYFIPPSGSYESLWQNARLQHRFIAPGATQGSASFTVTQ